ncbi:MAG TPA: DUF427 domain-containing protein [Ktedonobacterales bacterium]
MRPNLEDREIGPAGNPAEPYRWEPSPRHVRAVFNDVTVADSRRVMLLIEARHLPVFYFPVEDVRRDLLEPSDHHSSSPLMGEASFWSLRVGDRLAENAAWSYPHPPAHGPALAGYIAFYWTKLDAWYEEDERAYAHARDPYKLIDTRQSSRHVRVVLGATTVADTRRPLLLFETGLPVRYYIPQADVRMDLLESSDRVTECAYKGRASHWHARIGDHTYSNIAWTYHEPATLAAPIAGMVCFYNERVDALYDDDELLAKPRNQWSE